MVSIFMRVKGLEPSRSCPHKNLNLARLPIPPHPHCGVLSNGVIIPQTARFVKGVFEIF